MVRLYGRRREDVLHVPLPVFFAYLFFLLVRDAIRTQ